MMVVMFVETRGDRESRKGVRWEGVDERRKHGSR